MTATMLSGTLDSFNVVEILALVGRVGAEGALVVAGDDTGSVFCRDGEVTFATPSREVDLERALVRSGMIPAGAADGATGVASRLTSALAKDGDRERVNAFLRLQVEESIFELAQWHDGTFEFSAAEDDPMGDTVSFPVASVIEGVMNRWGRWAELMGRLGSVDAYVAPVPAPADQEGDVTISRSLWRFLAAIDGRHTIKELARVLGQGLFQTCEALADLLDLDLVALQDQAAAEGFVAASAPAAPSAPAPARSDAPIQPPQHHAAALVGLSSNGRVLPPEQPAPSTNGKSRTAAKTKAPKSQTAPAAVPAVDVSELAGPANVDDELPGLRAVLDGDRANRDVILRLLSAVKEL